MKFITAPKLLNLLIYVVVGVVFLNSCHSNNLDSEDNYVKLVKTRHAETVSSFKKKTFPGILKEDKKMNLSFRVSGPILKYYVEEGDYVKKGQLIVEMDPRDYEVQKQAAQTQVKQLQAEYQRIKELNDRQSVADNDYEKMKAGKELAETKLKNADDQLSDTRVYAPYSGYITKVDFDAGELVGKGTPVASIIAVNLLKVEINVPASLYINKKQITKIECTQEDIPDKVFPLNLYSDGKKADNSGLYTLYLSYTPTSDSKLMPGMNVSVDVFINNCDKNL
ncbi:MAG: efflux RND transporter periplasmic adaptor subunit, partial [Bacteroidales bacterium]|nr:efflux RND transporter periplasmic adaptor subunit [Bacteroidales bacterium]